MPRTFVALLLLVWVSVLGGCAFTPPGRLAVVTPPDEPPTTQLEDLRVPEGTRVVVYRRDGEVLSGRLRRLDATGVQLAPEGDAKTPRVVPDEEIQRVGVIVGRSRPARAWMGFAVAAVLSLPLSMSMVGDAVLLAGGLGAWAGSSTGDSRVELRLDRP